MVDNRNLLTASALADAKCKKGSSYPESDRCRASPSIQAFEHPWDDVWINIFSKLCWGGHEPSLRNALTEIFGPDFISSNITAQNCSSTKSKLWRISHTTVAASRQKDSSWGSALPRTCLIFNEMSTGGGSGRIADHAIDGCR
jgi:hypothetical protein